jgi:PPOX class probable F420-dependent enzyme
VVRLGRPAALALTEAHSGKVRRIRRDPHVLVAPCRPDGKLRGALVPASAEVLTTAPELDHVQRLLRNRYKISYPLVVLGYRLGHLVRRGPSMADGAALAITVGERESVA